jgi:hypothetical protein
MKIIRVFPRKTKATPIDELVRINRPPGLFDDADEVHISVAFTWDLPRAEWLAKQWESVAPVKIGGPATGEKGGDFIPGVYLKHGYVITSRGCPNNCWFCSVPKREGRIIRELPITEGYNLLDDNLLACSSNHIWDVFKMLSQQDQYSDFTGGLEANRLTYAHCLALRGLKPKQLFFAYDTPDDLKPLQEAGKMLINVGFTTQSHTLRCYVLCGYKGDTITKAESRMKETLEAGFTPMAMLYRRDDGWRNHDFIGGKFQKKWARPGIIHAVNKY